MFMYKEITKGIQLNDKHTISHNKTFEVILNKDCQLISRETKNLLR
jgi:hypothetical protein